MQTAFNPDTETILIRLLIQFAVIIASAKIVGALFARFGQVRTMGEISAGIFLGPTLFGWMLPGLSSALFPPATAATPNIIPFFSHIALVFTLFLIGLEFDFREVPKHARQVVLIAVSSLVLPVGAGVLCAPLLWKVAPGSGEYLPYALFIGICMAITAIPIMGRVLMEEGLTRTRLGVLGISTGAVKDIITWFCMAVVIGISRPPLNLGKVATMIVATTALGLFMLLVGPKVVARAKRFWPVEDGRPHPNMLVFLLVLLLLSASATSEIGIFAIFGAFLSGVMVSFDRELSESVSKVLHDMTIYFLLPLFFTYTGLRADFTLLTAPLIGLMLLVTVVTSLANCLPTYFFSRLQGMDSRESTAMAALINMPGLMVLIILNIGYDLKVLPPVLFSVLLGVAMIRNLAVAPILRRFGPRKPSATSEPPEPAGTPREANALA
jgi:Kef-type K+ transport system membrane component KefB